MACWRKSCPVRGFEETQLALCSSCFYYLILPLHHKFLVVEKGSLETRNELFLKQATKAAIWRGEFCSSWLFDTSDGFILANLKSKLLGWQAVLPWKNKQVWERLEMAACFLVHFSLLLSLLVMASATVETFAPFMQLLGTSSALATQTWVYLPTCWTSQLSQYLCIFQMLKSTVVSSADAPGYLSSEGP